MYVCFVLRFFLGLTDREVETVFRTTDGFITPWVKWGSTEPSGNTGRPEGKDDCVTWHSNYNGVWADNTCSTQIEYYCEGSV